MAYTASWPVERPTVLGLVAAAVWLVGLAPQADLRAWPGCFADRLVCNFFVSFCFTRVDRTPRGYRLSYG